MKNVKPNFKTLGRKYGKQMKQIQNYFANMSQDEIHAFEKNNGTHLDVDGVDVELTLEDALISTQDIPGWAVTSEGNFTVALDMTITEDLFNEGLARELVNRVQTLRKNSGLEVTDRIEIIVEKNEKLEKALEKYRDYICGETLADAIKVEEKVAGDNMLEDELTENVKVTLRIEKKN